MDSPTHQRPPGRAAPFRALLSTLGALALGTAPALRSGAPAPERAYRAHVGP